jgi:hypothetical protein
MLRYNIFIVIPKKVIPIMNKQDVENSLPFRAVKKILKKTYPFIVRLEVPEGVEQYSSLIFLDIYIDIYKLKEFMPKYEIDNFYMKYYLDYTGANIWGSSTLSPFFQGGSTDERYDYFRPLVGDIIDILKSVSRSNAIPEELKLTKGRTFDISNFFIDKDILRSGLPSQP